MKYEDCDDEKSKPFKEVSLFNKTTGRSVSSQLLPVTDDEIQKAKELYKTKNECNHSIAFDEFGFIYHNRYCYICGIGLGLV
jgi:hypothetical protein